MTSDSNQFLKVVSSVSPISFSVLACVLVIMLRPELVVMTRTSALTSKLLLASQTFAVH